MSKKFNRKLLKSSDAKKVLKQATQALKTDLKKFLGLKLKVEEFKIMNNTVWTLNGDPLILKIENKILPTLAFKEAFKIYPKVVVDMGAIPHVCNGANIMRPGIISFEGEFKKGDLIYVVDEKHGKSLAIGQSLFNKENMKKSNKGIVIKNLHFVGDKIWELIRKIS